MHTLGYRFRPWTESKAIADGDSILRYVRATAPRPGSTRRSASTAGSSHTAWSSAEARWTVTAESVAGERETLTCGFLWMCSGYYRYD